MMGRANKGISSIWLWIFGVFLAAVGIIACGPPTAALDRVPVQILAINDFHGQISAGKKVKGRPVGSAPVLAAYLKKEQQEFSGFTFVVHAGDQVGASPPASALLQDEPAIMFLNLLGNGQYSNRDRLNPRGNLVATLGNHEFDEGLKELQRLLEGGNHPQGPFLQDPWPGRRLPLCVGQPGEPGHPKTHFSPVCHQAGGWGSHRLHRGSVESHQRHGYAFPFDGAGIPG